MQYTDKELSIKIAEEAKEAGGDTYYVGGLVRDELLGRENKDIDIEIYGIETELLTEILSKFGVVDTIGASFGVLNIHGYGLDIAQPRKEKTTGFGHKDLDVQVDPFLDTKTACERRDITINSMMRHVLTGEIIDHFGGQEDLKNGIIRHVSSWTFAEDPLRVLRVAQFAARFGFKIADETIQLAKQANLSTLPKERVSGELFKALLKADRPSIFFNSMYEMNQTEWFKEVYALKEVPQDPIWHPEGDAYTHTMNVIDHAAKLRYNTDIPIRYMMAALTHDLGKATATKIDEISGKIIARGHDEQGTKIASNFVKRLTDEKGMETYVTNMVALHMRTHNNFTDSSKVRTTNLMFDKSINPYDLILLTEADSRGAAVWGQNNPEYIKRNIEEEKEWLMKRLVHYKEIMKRPKMTGKDLIAMGVEPGPDFTKALFKAHQLHLSETSWSSICGTIRSMFGIKNPEREGREKMSLQDIQLDIINKHNPAPDDIHTWIRGVEDIKFYKDTIENPEEDITPDFTSGMIKEALQRKHITVYSSYPISQGVFVTPSKMEAQSYAGNGPIYEKTVKLTDVAWLDELQGQYANPSEKDNEQELNSVEEYDGYDPADD